MENNKILATIFIPVYNQENLVIRALDSLPIRNDIEILILNDGSTDNTLYNILKYQINHKEKNIKIFSYKKNRGLGCMKNIAFKVAKGIYIGELDSDDYLYTDLYNKALSELDEIADMVYINLKDNENNIFLLNEQSKNFLCGGPCKFIKKSFLGNEKCPEVKTAGEDWVLNEKLQKKPHIDKFTNIIAYHYNFPRQGSLFNNLINKNNNNFINAISIIIPTKDNKENTKKLLKELIYQKNTYYPETEIIVIENNSIEDMSFLDNYKDIIVKHEITSGVSQARNIGLKLAKGEYIAFIDNDDFIRKDFLQQLYPLMRKTKCDWCTFPWYVDKQPICYEIDLNKPLETSKSCWAYCFNRRIIQDIKFNEQLKAGEDIDWISKVITSNTKGVKLNEPIYYYTWDNNENSLSHKFNRGEI